MLKRVAVILALTLLFAFATACAQEESKMADNEYRDLTPQEAAVIVHKGTERPFTGEYYDYFEPGTYQCRRCGAELYRSTDKFRSTCGWPSFDDEIEGAVLRQTDADGRRTEILCANCGAHLGHVFEGEMLTDKNVRHCVNSISLTFVPEGSESGASPQEEGKPDVGAPDERNTGAIAPDGSKTDTSVSEEKAMERSYAYFAGGCFWGVEYQFEQMKGVISAVSGYMGGAKEDPTYREVCTGTTGHLEAVRVEYDPAKVSYEELARYFFEIHDPTQASGQGPDIGEQYMSAVFYSNDEEKQTAEKLIGILKGKGYDVVTRVVPATTFWEAEDYHQDYYARKGHEPYCHAYKKRF